MTASPSADDERVRKYSVLVVEDDVLVRMMISDALREEGCVVVEAATGDEAWEVLSSAAAPDLILTDVRMPGSIDGIDLAQRVRAKWPTMKLVVVSGHVQAPLPPNTADSFFCKPYRLEEVAERIRALLGVTADDV
jgi:CheY-like chemotaxis protein